MSYHDMNDGRTDGEVFDQVKKAYDAKFKQDETGMAATMREHLTQVKGSPLTQVKTDAPLSLTGQWGGAHPGALLLATWVVFIVIGAAGVIVGMIQRPKPEPPAPVCETSSVKRAQATFWCARAVGCRTEPYAIEKALRAQQAAPQCFLPLDEIARSIEE